jgi:hypothetical protein
MSTTVFTLAVPSVTKCTMNGLKHERLIEQYVELPQIVRGVTTWTAGIESSSARFKMSTTVFTLAVPSVTNAPTSTGPLPIRCVQPGLSIPAVQYTTTYNSINYRSMYDEWSKT